MSESMSADCDKCFDVVQPGDDIDREDDRIDQVSMIETFFLLLM
jgi:hypothetical protein